MVTDLSPTARALRTLEVLHDLPGVTAGELSDRLGVTERAARRYVGILREAGIPVESIRGPYGGYRLGRGTRLPPVIFTEAEALGLVMAALDGGSAPADAGDVVGDALTKVVRALPDAIGRKAAELREHASSAPVPNSARPDPAIVSALAAAVSARRRVRITYSNRPGREWDDDVDAWAVIVRSGLWYLLCHSHGRRAIRTYRVDRVRAVAQLPHRFTPPDGLDPVAALEENLGAGWEFDTRVTFMAPIGDVAPWIRPVMGRLEAAGGGCVLTGSTSNPQMYAGEWLAGVPFDFHIDGGPELQAAAETLADRFAAAVRRKTPRRV